MREIKFRGYAFNNWVYGDLMHIPECKETNMKAQAIIVSDNNRAYVVDSNTIGQYTGLKDKNGVGIYEGDIVIYETRTNRATDKERHEVVFEERGGSGYFGITISPIETWKFCLEVPAKLMEVIGNIYDTAEQYRAEMIEQCGGCPAFSGDDCTRNPYTEGCLKEKTKREMKTNEQTPIKREIGKNHRNANICGFETRV